MRKLLLAFVAVVALFAWSGSALAADGDNLRQIIADRGGFPCSSVDADGNHSGIGTGIGFNGTNLLLTCWGDNHVVEVSPADGHFVAAHTIVGATDLRAVAWDDTRHVLWACNGTDTVGQIDLSLNTYVAVFVSQGCIDGLAYDASDDTIWSSDDVSPHTEHYTTAGVLISSNSNVGLIGGCGNSGIAASGSNLYLANNGCSQIYRVAKDFSSSSLFATFPRRIEDLECDNITFAPKGAIWSNDAYDNILNAWEITASTCIFGGGPKALTLTPPTAENPVGSSHTVTATLTDANGPVSGAHILFTVTGVNVAAGDGTTDASGQTSFTYSDTLPGNDTITACYDKDNNNVCDPGETTATATKTWAGAGPPAAVTLTPPAATNPAGQQHCVTATVVDANGTPVPNATVNFTVTGANPTTGTGTTDANGQAQFCYTGTHAGNDTITATVQGGSNPSATATKTYTAGPAATVTVTPATATNPVGQQHCVTATVTDQFGNPVAGAPVTFSVTGANPQPNTTVTTDANGHATFCYTGTHAGTDTITASTPGAGGTTVSGRATKVYRPGPPASLTLTPKAASNPVGSQHCVTATVTDAFGNPTPGIVVDFKVSGSDTVAGSATTDANGQATFCYQVSALPGADVITATAHGGTNPTDTATKTITPPSSTAGCKVTGGGRILAADGDKATFGGNAMGSGPSGVEEYQDHGPAMDINVHSINVLAVVCSADRTSASIFGTATVNGAGSYSFRIDVRDLGEPGRNDRYRIRLSNGYDSGDQQLTAGGNIQIH
jgi:hypothetical protein